MKRLGATNETEVARQINRTRQVWQPRLGRDLSEEGARQIMHNVTGFFSVLAEWSRAERLAAANDAAAPAVQREMAVAMTAEIIAGDLGRHRASGSLGLMARKEPA